MQKILLLWLVTAVLSFQGVAFNVACTPDSHGVSGTIIASDFRVSHLQLNEGYSTETSAELLAPNIILSVVDYESRIARLSWTTDDVLTPGYYLVERQITGSGAFDVLKQLPYTTNFYYEDTISYPYCSLTSFTYRISFVSDLGLHTPSNVPPPVLLFDFKNNPATVSDLVVSINSNQQPVLTWSKVTTDTIQSYEISRYNGFSWPVIITVPADTVHFIDKTVADACITSYSYVINTIDRCGNISDESYEDISVQTIKLDLPVIDDCERLAKLSWNDYLRMPGGLGGYRIHRMDNYGAPVLVAVVKDPLITFYTDAFNFENSHTYTYYVEAFSTDSAYSSFSCRQGWKYNGANVADSVYISTLSVNNDSYISVMYYSTPDETVKTLVLERSDDGGLTYHTVDSATVAIGFFPQQGVLNDSSADVHSQSYYYRVVAIDFCGIHRLYSNVSRSVFLQCSATETQNTIEWNGYESWLKGVEGYQVWRNWDIASATGELLADVPAGVHSYDDLLSGIDPNEEVCYAVLAYESPASPYLTNASSWSNICCISKDAKLYMPNAFNPNGANYRFRPVATSVDTDSFKMTIFNRWGQQIYETTDIINGWDGNIDGKTATTGLYGYIIKYRSTSGQDYTTRGTVSIVK